MTHYVIWISGNALHRNITYHSKNIPVPRYRDSPRIAKKFEFTYPGTTSLYAPGSLSGTPSGYGTGSSQTYSYSRMGVGSGGGLGSAAGEEPKPSPGYHSLDAVTSSTTGSGGTSLTATMPPQSHHR